MDFNPLAFSPAPGDRQKLITLTYFRFLNYLRRRSNKHSNDSIDFWDIDSVSGNESNDDNLSVTSDDGYIDDDFDSFT